jgi:hypothetical protein
MGFGYGTKVLKAKNIVFAYDEDNNKWDSTNKKSLLGDSPSTTTSNYTYYPRGSLVPRLMVPSAAYNQTAEGDGFSMLAWIRRTAGTTGSWNTMFTIDSGGSGGTQRTIWFGWYYNQTWRIHHSHPYWANSSTGYYWSSDPYLTSIVSSPTYNTWYHYAAYYTNSTRALRQFFNGQLVSTATRPGYGDLNYSNTTVKLFGTNGSSYGNSQIKSLTLFDTFLTDEAVLDHFNATKNRFGY